MNVGSLCERKNLSGPPGEAEETGWLRLCSVDAAALNC
jgi:hypothetical protein